MRKTYVVDIDGTIFKHLMDLSTILEDAQYEDTQALPGVREVFDRWKNESAFIILLTARPESMREITEKQVSKANLFFDQLVMGVGNGPRYIINDVKPNGMITAHAISVERNKGFAHIEEFKNA